MVLREGKMNIQKIVKNIKRKRRKVIKEKKKYVNRKKKIKCEGIVFSQRMKINVWERFQLILFFVFLTWQISPPKQRREKDNKKNEQGKDLYILYIYIYNSIKFVSFFSCLFTRENIFKHKGLIHLRKRKKEMLHPSKKQVYKKDKEHKTILKDYSRAWVGD